MLVESDKISIIHMRYTIQSCISLHVHALTQNKQDGLTLMWNKRLWLGGRLHKTNRLVIHLMWNKVHDKGLTVIMMQTYIRLVVNQSINQSINGNIYIPYRQNMYTT